MRQKNKLKLLSSLFLILALSFSLSSCFEKEKKVKEDINSGIIDKVNVGDDIINLDSLNIKGDYKTVISKLESKGLDNLSREEKFRLLYSYSNYGNYYYDEKSVKEKVNSLLKTMDNSWEKYYNSGYVKEINKNYSGALNDYNKSLSFSGLTNKNKSIIVNQIGHVYDLSGNLEEAGKNYKESNKLDKENISAISNLARYYTKIGELSKAKIFMEKALEKNYILPERAEIYYGLSSIELELNGLTPNLDKSIEYAKKSIKAYSDYPMGYVALARGLYMKNNEKYYSEIEKNLKKAIKLNPNNSLAYEFLGLLELDKGNTEKAISIFRENIIKIYNDPILTEDLVESSKLGMFFYGAMIKNLKDNSDNSEKILEFIINFGGKENGKIKLQIQRKNYGLFYNLKENKEFLNILN